MAGEDHGDEAGPGWQARQDLRARHNGRRRVSGAETIATALVAKEIPSFVYMTQVASRLMQLLPPAARLHCLPHHPHYGPYHRPLPMHSHTQGGHQGPEGFGCPWALAVGGGAPVNYIP